MVLHRQVVAELTELLKCHVDIVEMETTIPCMRSAVMQNRILLPRSDDKDNRLSKLISTAKVDQETAIPQAPPNLYQQRMEAVLLVLKKRGAKRVIELGCGQAWMIEKLAQDSAFEVITGIDLSQEALQEARNRLQRNLSPPQYQKLRLFHGLLTWRDPRFRGYDTAIVMEVIEHMDPPRLSTFERVLFEFINPATIVITTPNAEYNVKWRIHAQNNLRRDDHYFEWTRNEFKEWASSAAKRFGYIIDWQMIGPEDSLLGAPTQMGIFTRCSISS